MSNVSTRPRRAIRRLRDSVSRRVIVATLILLAVAGAAAAVLVTRLEVVGTEAEQPPVTAMVERRDVVSSLATIGNVEYVNIVGLEFGQSGVLRDLNADVGELVTAGTVLAQLEVTDFEQDVADAASSLQQAEWQLERLLRPPDPAGIERAELDVREAKAALDDLLAPAGTAAVAAAEASVVSAQIAYERAVQDLKDVQAGPSTLDLLEAEGAIAAAQASLASAELGLQELRAGPTVAAVADFVETRSDLDSDRIASGASASAAITRRAPLPSKFGSRPASPSPGHSISACCGATASVIRRQSSGCDRTARRWRTRTLRQEPLISPASLKTSPARSSSLAAKTTQSRRRNINANSLLRRQDRLSS